MKTPKQKAIELVNKYVNLFPHPTEEYLDTDEAKRCALIAVDEILCAVDSSLIDSGIIRVTDSCRYWDAVKKEIETS